MRPERVCEKVRVIQRLIIAIKLKVFEQKKWNERDDVSVLELISIPAYHYVYYHL